MSSEHPIIVGTMPATNGSAAVNGNGAAGAPPAVNGNGSALPRSSLHSAPGSSYRGENSGNVGTFGVKSGLAQMLKGGVIMVSYDFLADRLFFLTHAHIPFPPL